MLPFFVCWLRKGTGIAGLWRVQARVAVQKFQSVLFALGEIVFLPSFRLRKSSFPAWTSFPLACVLNQRQLQDTFAIWLPRTAIFAVPAHSRFGCSGVHRRISMCIYRAYFRLACWRVMALAAIILFAVAKSISRSPFSFLVPARILYGEKFLFSHL